MNDQKIALPVELFNAIGSYLVERPFKEVSGLLNAMSQVQQAQQAQSNAVRDVPPPPKAA